MDKFEIRGYRHISSAVDESLIKINDIANGRLKPLVSSLTIERNKMGGIYPGDFLTIAARTGMGKCFGKGTLIRMYDGSVKAVEDIVVGDLIMGNDSTPRTVLSTVTGREQLYLVKQNNAMDYVINESHILSLITREQKVHNLKVTDYFDLESYNKRKETKTYAIKGKSLSFNINVDIKHEALNKNNLFGYRVPISYEHLSESYTDFIFPYFFGVWYFSKNRSIDKIKLESELLTKYFCDYLDYQAHSYSCDVGKGIIYFSDEFSNQLKKYENFKRDDFKPYIYNSNENCFNFLGGIVDSDKCQIVNSRYEIQYDNDFDLFILTELLKHIGFNFTVYSRNNINYLSFGGNFDKINNRLKYKKIKIFTKTSLRSVISIEPLGEGDYYGFELDGNKLFCLEDYTVTHNTSRVVHLIKDYLNVTLNPYYEDKLIILFDSWEMLDWRMMIRMYTKELNMSVRDILNYEDRVQVEQLQLIEAIANEFKNKNLYFAKSSRTVDKWYHSKKDIQKQFPNIRFLNVIDHARLALKSNQTKEEELISDLAKAGMALKKEEEQMIVMLSQMNRNIEANGRGDELGYRLPIASDIFGSDAIFQCSDLVLALHRPGYYGLTQFPINTAEKIPTGISATSSEDNLMIECLLKNRDGWTGNMVIGHNIKYNNFFDFKKPKKII